MLLVLSGCVLGLLILEIAVRVLDVRPRPIAPLRIAAYRLSDDPVLGYEYRPGYKPFVINSAGFRDYEHAETKTAETYRIIVLGDSTTAGEGVSDLDKTYTKQLEKLLNTNNASGMRYEVLNMGVAGYHTLQEVETLRVKGLKYHPDLVVLTFCVNDFDVHGDGGLARLSNPSMVNNLYNRLLRVSRLAFVIHHRLRIIDRINDDYYVKNILKGQTTVRAGFTLLAELQQRGGFSTLVVILPAFDYPFTDYKHSDIHQQVFQAAEGLPSIPVIDLLPSFARLDNNARKFSYDQLHMNEHGHKAMAEILLPLILRQITERRARSTDDKLSKTAEDTRDSKASDPHCRHFRSHLKAQRRKRIDNWKLVARGSEVNVKIW